LNDDISLIGREASLPAQRSISLYHLLFATPPDITSRDAASITPIRLIIVSFLRIDKHAIAFNQQIPRFVEAAD